MHFTVVLETELEKFTRMLPFEGLPGSTLAIRTIVSLSLEHEQNESVFTPGQVITAFTPEIGVGVLHRRKLLISSVSET